MNKTQIKAIALSLVFGLFMVFPATASAEADAPPVITKQPSSQTVTVGDSVTFSITATGTPPLTYDWQAERGFGWLSISETSSSFTLPEVYNFYNGTQYRCRVTNSFGTVYSDVATLTANKPPSTPPQTTTPEEKPPVANKPTTPTTPSKPLAKPPVKPENKPKPSDNTGNQPVQEQPTADTPSTTDPVDDHAKPDPEVPKESAKEETATQPAQNNNMFWPVITVSSLGLIGITATIILLIHRYKKHQAKFADKP